MIEKMILRAVLDTNIIISAFKTKNVTSPTRELLIRWTQEEFVLVLSKELLSEYVEKMMAKRIPAEQINYFLQEVRSHAHFVLLPDDEVESIVADDSDDDIVIGTALAGGATHLVTYDQHLLSLGSPFRGIEIVKGLPFLYAVRGDVPPHTNKKS